MKLSWFIIRQAKVDLLFLVSDQHSLIRKAAALKLTFNPEIESTIFDIDMAS